MAEEENNKEKVENNDISENQAQEKKESLPDNKEKTSEDKAQSQGKEESSEDAKKKGEGKKPKAVIRKKRNEDIFSWWPVGLWGVQVAFYLFGCGVFFLSLSTQIYKPDMWYYFLLWTILVICASVNAMFSKHSLLYFTNILLGMINTFVIPFALYAYGKSVVFGVTTDLFFVISALAVVPRLVGGGIVIGAIVFSFFLMTDKDEFHKSIIVKEEEIQEIKKHLTPGQLYSTPYANYRVIAVEKPAKFPEISALPNVYGDPAYWKYLYDANSDRIKEADTVIPEGTLLIVPYERKNIRQNFLQLALIFIAASLVAFCWKLLIMKLYEFLTVRQPTVEVNPKIRQKLEKVEKDLEEKEKIIRVFKEEIALAIIEMKKIMKKS